MEIENSNLEFKCEFTNDVKNTIIAFANTQGGIIKIGMADNGEICGVENVDNTLTRLTNTVRDTILPDITMFISYDISEEKVIIVTVREGTNKPYFLKDKGMKPSGIYVRHGASSAQASWDQIRSMIKQTDGDKYETLRSFEQDLTFSYAKEEFKNSDIPFNESKYITLGIMKGDKTFSNLGLLISDQCQHTIKIAVFDGIEKKVFIDRKEIGGSLLKQLRDAYNYLDLNNKTHATFSGINRIDSRDYSEIVIREALVNAIVHRDYGFSGSIIVNVYENRMEFISLGGLVGGLSKNDILSGISQTRNEKLANIFYRLKHIETYGYGLPNIFNDYNESSIQPEIKVTDNAFVIIIPNKNYILNILKENDAEIYSISHRLTENEKFVISFIKSNGFITREIIEKELNLKQSRAYQIIRKMQNDNLIAVSLNDKKKFILLK